MNEPIAIVGMACLFPDAASPESFWHNLVDGRDSTSLATAEDMGVEPGLLYDAAKGRRDRYYALRGGFVRAPFDPVGYRLPPEQLAGLDKLYAWTLTVARQALADSGALDDALTLERCGLILGNLSFPTHASHRLLAPIYRRAVEAALSELAGRPVTLDPGPFSGELSPDAARICGGPAGLAARALGLGAGWLALDAACASSLYAIRLACDSLAAGKADLMVAGAVSAADPLFIHMGFSIFQAYPDGGASRPLDRSSRGLTSGQGAGALVLKRYADALQDGDRVYAVIKAVGWSNDGAGRHVLVPNPKGQLLAYERAYGEAGLTPEQVAYIECHATGTPVGDTTELQTIEQFFGARGHIPLLGSVKSNFGHLLTAAGMAGVIKVVLSMTHGLIPPTINVEEPVASPSGAVGPRQIVRSAVAWPGAGPRRAAVSAFGFGGTNAHLVLEREGPRAGSWAMTGPPATPAPRPEPLAIVGMGACFGPWQSLAALKEGLTSGEQAFRPLPSARWKGLEADVELLQAYGLEGGAPPRGAYIDSFTIDSLRFKIPPAAGDQPIPQQLLILKVADEALRDAGMRPGGNVAVLVAMEAELAVHQFRARVDLSWQLPRALERAGVRLTTEELETIEGTLKDALHDPAQVNQYTSFIGNLMACRIAALWDFSGPAFTVSGEECGTFRALEIAQAMLVAGTVEAVVVGAVDLAGGLEQVFARSLAVPAGDSAVGHDVASGGWLVGEGAGAIVLRRRADAARDSRPIYAVVEALDIVARKAGEAGAAAVARAASGALRRAAVSPAQVASIELSASGLPDEDTAELEGLAQVYRAAGAETGLTCATGSAKANLGHTQAAAGVAGLIRAALALHGRVHLAAPGWSAPRRPETWAATPFYVPAESRPWLAPRVGRRVAAVSGIGGDGTCAHVVLSEADTPLVALYPAFPARRPLPALLPLAAAEPAGLYGLLDELEREARAGTPPEAMARSRIAAWHERGGSGSTLVLVAATAADLLREIGQVRAGLPGALARGHPLETPGGSAFTPRPLGAGALAFVYPGAFTSYPGLGRGLLTAFPTLHDRLGSIVSDPGAATAAHHLYARQQRRPNEADIERQKARLRADAPALIAAGTSFATLYTALLRDGFGLAPRMALGYSMGEASMQWALGLWRDGDAGLRRLAGSPLFGERLAGRRAAARAYLGLGADAGEDFWQVYVVRARAERARDRLRGERKAFLTHINTPSEVVIAGAADALPPILADLGGEAFRAPFGAVIHCPPAEAEYDSLVALHRLPLAAVPDVRLYTAAEYGPAEPESERIAHNIARATCQPVDFPRLVERVYADGARIFVEVGPGGSCARWIGEILVGREHAALAVNRSGADERLALVQLLARLVAHGVPVDLTPLTASSVPSLERVRALPKSITLGGASLREAILSEEHRQVVRAALNASSTPSNAISTPSKSVGAQPSKPETILQQAALLNERQSAMRRLAAEVAAALRPARAPAPPGAGHVWEEPDLLEFAQGSIARVFGPDYAIIDSYPRRVRLPMPPYLLVSRVTRLEAARGRFEPSAITTEYDIPPDAWYCVDGQAPWAVSVEAGQCDLLLISYLGIDFQCRGERVYRLLDCTLTFLDELPKAGETLRYDIRINAFARSGDTLLFFFSYECFVGERPVLRMDGGCAGFFSDAELAGGRGVIDSERELAARRAAAPRAFTPPLNPSRASLGRDDLRRLSAGDLAGCFGAAYHQGGRNPSLRLPPPMMLMLDRVVSIDPRGGPWGLGLIVAEKDLGPDDWYFPCHFKGDQVLAGSLMAEGCGQLLQCYMLLQGFQARTFDARFQPIPGLPQQVRCRGQVTPDVRLMRYRMEITELGLDPEPFARANVDIIVDGLTIVRFTDLGLLLREKSARLRAPLAPAGEEAHDSARGRPLCDEGQMREFATGSLAACFGPDYAIYEGRRAPRTPNGELQLISRVLSVAGQRRAPRPGATLVSEYDVPANPWFCHENSYPTTPYSVLMELGLQPCGFLSAWLGSTLGYPGHDFYFRNLDGLGVLRREPDLRGKTVRNRVTLRSSTALDGVIIQKFDYALECDGEPFFEGDAAFGYFTPETLANQTGLDGGRATRPWLAGPHGLPVASAGLSDPRHPLYSAAPGRLHERLPGGRFHLLDRADVVSGGGRHGQGYVYAERAVNAIDWFFACHFFQDPVMPGSLGVEAMLRAMQVLALHEGLGAAYTSPRFAVPAGRRCIWKYRGQIPAPAGDSTMRLEVHIVGRERSGGQTVLVGEGGLWRDELRIYEVKGLALALMEAEL